MDLKKVVNSFCLKFKNFFIENKIISFMFILSTLFFLIQHYFYLGWDFSAYVLNSKYFFSNGSYLEVYRAPMASFILGVLLPFGKLAEYIYIILISSLFFFSTVKLSICLYGKYFSKFKLTKKQFQIIFYLLNLNVFLLVYGLVEGTELLALSFFQLFLVSFLSNKTSGHFLALSFLSRYNFLIFFPILFFNKSIKKIIKNVIFAAITIIPWLIYNFVSFGNFFTSIIDSYYLNIFSRVSLVEPLNFSHFLHALNFFIPFFILGIFFGIKYILKNKEKFLRNINLFYLFLTFIFLWDIIKTPFKIERYLFNLILIISFFSIQAISYIVSYKDKFKKIIFIILKIIFIFSFIVGGIYVFLSSADRLVYYEASQTMVELGLENCQFLSPMWVPVNYYSGNVLYLGNFNQAILDKNLVLIFNKMSTIDDSFTFEDLKNTNKLFENSEYTIFGLEGLTGDSCRKKRPFVSPMVSNPCNLLSERFTTFNKTVYGVCKFVNLEFLKSPLNERF